MTRAVLVAATVAFGAARPLRCVSILHNAAAAPCSSHLAVVNYAVRHTRLSVPAGIREGNIQFFQKTPIQEGYTFCLNWFEPLDRLTTSRCAGCTEEKTSASVSPNYKQLPAMVARSKDNTDKWKVAVLFDES
jgi:hypothetical protein